MTITLSGRKLLSFASKILNWLKWPSASIAAIWIASPRFWNFWKHSHPDGQLILGYVDSLKWPTLLLIIFLSTRRYIPGILDRVEEITAWKMGVKLARPQKQEPPSEKLSAPEGEKAAEDSGVDSTDENLETLLTSKEVEDTFDQLYSNIYGSQLMVMKRLLEHVPQGLSADDFGDLYEAHLKSSNNPYPTLKHFIQYLLDNSLVLYDLADKRYKLTNAGVYFLRYLNKIGKYNMMPLN